MSFQVIVFYSFAAGLIFSALMVVSSKHSVKAALFLVLAFASASAIWLLLEAEFLAISLIVVYVGAVMVLLLFVVMMLDVDYAALRQGFVKKLPLAVIISLLFLGVLYAFISSGTFSALEYPNPRAKPSDYSNIRELGLLLYQEYVVAFEIAAVILLVAIIAAIALTFRGRRNRKAQNVSKQLAANKHNRLKVISMDPVIATEQIEAENAEPDGESNNIESKNTESKNTESKNTEPKITESKNTEYKNTESKNVETENNSKTTDKPNNNQRSNGQESSASSNEQRKKDSPKSNEPKADHKANNPATEGESENGDSPKVAQNEKESKS